MPLMDGGEFDWDLCHPGLLLTRLVSESSALQAGFKDALSRHPCTASRPWGLVVGFDEHVPGNKLDLVQSRKSMNLSFSFEELGGLACESSCSGDHTLKSPEGGLQPTKPRTKPTPVTRIFHHHHHPHHPRPPHPTHPPPQSSSAPIARMATAT